MAACPAQHLSDLACLQKKPKMQKPKLLATSKIREPDVELTISYRQHVTEDSRSDPSFALN